MPRPKQQTREERLEKRRLYERRRKERIKSNEVSREEFLRKDRETYARRKAAGLIVSRHEMTTKKLKILRRKNKISAAAYYERKKNRAVPVPAPSIMHRQDSKPFESTAEMDSATSILSEANADVSVKLELFEEEEAKLLRQYNFEEHSEKSTEHPKKILQNVPLHGETQTCMNCKGSLSTNNKCEKCEGITNQLVNRNEFDVFGESIAAQLKNMPLVNALEAQMYIQNYLSNARLQTLRFQTSS